MIEQYLMHSPPRLQLLFIDEAQDLTPLQWEMVSHMRSNADRVVYAGDDDQAIHRWTGVDVKKFMSVTDNVEILSQSYRLPKRVFDLSQQIVKRIQTRFEKEFYPTEEDGVVDYHLTLDSVPIHQGSWTIMARTNSFVKEFADIIREAGYLYSMKGHPSIKTEVGRAIQTWRELQAGDMVAVDRIKKMYEVVPKQGDFKVVKRGAGNLLDAADPTGELNIDALYKDYGLECERTRDAMDVVRLGNDDKMYVQAIERRGESITQPPRIKLSTFHAMKGGEDDNCLVFLASTKACMESKYPDDEHRAFYVGVTRAKKELHILDTDKRYRYEL
jgi:superfamily I DNA/RNA helicase